VVEFHWLFTMNYSCSDMYNIFVLGGLLVTVGDSLYNSANLCARAHVVWCCRYSIYVCARIGNGVCHKSDSVATQVTILCTTCHMMCVCLRQREHGCISVSAILISRTAMLPALRPLSGWKAQG
jgi:hypothetical protein